jgi:hypothetical protein
VSYRLESVSYYSSRLQHIGDAKCACDSYNEALATSHINSFLLGLSVQRLGYMPILTYQPYLSHLAR